MAIQKAKIEKFMLESNQIEGENRLNKNDVKAATAFLKRDLTEESVLQLHLELSEGRKILRGQYRDCQVYVGAHIPPRATRVPFFMEGLFAVINTLPAWEAHNEFEKIHPFEDLNGRVGRLIWLWIAIRKEKYNFQISFLHKYYYQTLDFIS